MSASCALVRSAARAEISHIRCRLGIFSSPWSLTMRKESHHVVLDERGDVRVREALPQDYRHVLAISSDVYWGRDYLPWRYHAILADPSYKAVVCQQKNDIVGFAAARLVDEGKTLVLTSGRVSEHVQGQGLAKVMLDHLRYACKGNSKARIRREAITTKGENKSMACKSSFKEDYQHVFQRAIHSYYFDIRTIVTPCKETSLTHEVPAALQCDKEQTVWSVLHTSGSERLFPEQRLVVKLVSVSSFERKLRYILHDNFVLLTMDEHHTGTGAVSAYCGQNCPINTRRKGVYERESSDHVAESSQVLDETLMTIGSHFPCNLGLAYNCHRRVWRYVARLSHGSTHVGTSASSTTSNSSQCSSVGLHGLVGKAEFGGQVSRFVQCEQTTLATGVHACL